MYHLNTLVWLAAGNSIVLGLCGWNVVEVLCMLRRFEDLFIKDRR